MSWIDDLSLDPATDIPDGTTVDEVLWGSKVTQRFLELAARVRTLSQRVQMVQTGTQTLTAGAWTTVLNMSYTQANKGYMNVTGMGAISSGLLTMPTGSAGQWAAFGQLAVNNVTGLSAIRCAIVQNGNRIMAGGGVASGTSSFQAVQINGWEFTVADGDTIGLQGNPTGADVSTTVLSGGATTSYLRLVKLP